jgi:hypothetical protein
MSDEDITKRPGLSRSDRRGRRLARGGRRQHKGKGGKRGDYYVKRPLQGL